ncbi:unnamed protein product [Prorocentrum cordatum]|uniref:Uncharacterized protein n=1 Tax=Prorocentrum cordatum TaxID=2364126 RepID=A0ABN9QQR4_9DINO|nr:unnamed protein product [Polarella glacialis]
MYRACCWGGLLGAANPLIWHRGLAVELLDQPKEVDAVAGVRQPVFRLSLRPLRWPGDLLALRAAGPRAGPERVPGQEPGVLARLLRGDVVLLRHGIDTRADGFGPLGGAEPPRGSWRQSRPKGANRLGIERIMGSASAERRGATDIIAQDEREVDGGSLRRRRAMPRRGAMAALGAADEHADVAQPPPECRTSGMLAECNADVSQVSLAEAASNLAVGGQFTCWQGAPSAASALPRAATYCRSLHVRVTGTSFRSTAADRRAASGAAIVEAAPSLDWAILPRAPTKRNSVDARAMDSAGPRGPARPVIRACADQLAE